MIVITGATGALNGATVDRLLERATPSDVAVVTRDPAKAIRFAERGVEVRHGDYADPASLPAAFQNADQLLLVSSNDPTADAVSLHHSTIDAAVAAGVGRILYTSHQGAALDSPFRPGRDHARTEQLLAESGLPWTALRNGFYSHSLNWMLGAWRHTGAIVVPADGPVSWTDRDDSAAAAAAILLSNGAYDGPVTLTARAAPTFEEIAQLASDLTGRTIEYTVVDAEQWVETQIAAGQQEFMVRFTLSTYQAAQEGFFAGVDPLLGTLLGREPRTVREMLAADATAHRS